MLYQRKKIQNKLSWNNLFVNQTYLLGTELLQQGLNNIQRSFWAKMTMAKVEAIQRTKDQWAVLVQLYKEDKE